MCVCVLGGEGLVGIILVFLCELFAVKKKRKHAMNVSSCNLVNSLIMYDMEIMIKISFVITLMLTAIIIIDFDCFQMSL